VDLCSRVTAPKGISNDLIQVKERGEEACLQFQNRVKEGSQFYNSIRKVKIRTFSDIKIPKVENKKRAKNE